MTTKTLFQKILHKEIPGTIVYEDDLAFVIKDIYPQAPIHLLIIPKKPIPRIAESSDEDTLILGHLLQVARKQATSLKLEKGFRIVINNGPHAGEEIPHLHLHLLANRQMHWPPG